MNDSKQLESIIDPIGGRVIETVNTELKSWLDLATIEHRAMVIKCCLAIRNSGGGRIIFGFDDKTGEPLAETENEKKFRDMLDAETIQEWISKYASPPFEIAIVEVARADKTYPVLTIEGGSNVPVTCRRDMFDDKKRLLEEHAVYVRSLSTRTSSGRISCTKASSDDWQSIVDRCFDRREADIAKFLRRHLPELSKGLGNSTDPSIEQLAKRKFNNSRQHFEHNNSLHSLSFDTTNQFCAFVSGKAKFDTITMQELRSITSALPATTGWTPWVDLTGAQNEDLHPQFNPSTKGWTAVLAPTDNGTIKSFDVWEIDPSGFLYTGRIIEECFSGYEKCIDPILRIDRTAEQLYHAILLSKRLIEGVDLTMYCRFYWSNLQGSRFCAVSDSSTQWLNHGDLLKQSNSPCYEDGLMIPLNTPSSSLWQFVKRVCAPLLLLFKFEISDEAYAEITERRINRR